MRDYNKMSLEELMKIYIEEKQMFSINDGKVVGTEKIPVTAVQSTQG